MARIGLMGKTLGINRHHSVKDAEFLGTIASFAKSTPNLDFK